MFKKNRKAHNFPIYHCEVPQVWCETWKPCIHSEKHEISNLGRCRNVTTKKILMPNKTRGGKYHGYGINGRTLYAHRLVVESFVFKGPIPKGLEINHIDSNRFRNELTNLEICNRAINDFEMRLRSSFFNRQCVSPSDCQWEKLRKMRREFSKKIRKEYKVFTVHLETRKALQEWK